jgi:hypothetical protein
MKTPKKDDVNVWDFIEKYYPNYTSSYEIALSNDLHKIVNDEVENGSHAHKILTEECYGDKDAAQKWLYEVDASIYEKAIEAYLKQGDKLHHEGLLVAAIISDNYIKSICKLQGDGGYIQALDSIAECSKAWCKAFEVEILNEGTDWDEVSEKNHASDWDELVTRFAGEWFLKTYGMQIVIDNELYK